MIWTTCLLHLAYHLVWEHPFCLLHQLKLLVYTLIDGSPWHMVSDNTDVIDNVTLLANYYPVWNRRGVAVNGGLEKKSEIK